MTYKQIAKVLRDRDGWKVSQQRVAKICGQAEEKLRKGLADCEW